MFFFMFFSVFLMTSLMLNALINYNKQEIREGLERGFTRGTAAHSTRTSAPTITIAIPPRRGGAHTRHKTSEDLTRHKTQATQEQATPRKQTVRVKNGNNSTLHNKETSQASSAAGVRRRGGRTAHSHAHSAQRARAMNFIRTHHQV